MQKTFRLKPFGGTGLGKSSWNWPRRISSQFKWSFNPYGLKPKLIALFTLLFVVLTLMISVLSFSNQKRFLVQEIEKRAELMADNLSISAREAVLDRDFLTLSSLLGAIQKDEDVVHAIIVDHREVVLMHSDVSKIGTPLRTDAGDHRVMAGFLEISRPIAYGEKHVGRVLLGVSQARAEGLILQAKMNLFKTMGFGLFLGALGILGLSNWFLKPVSALAKATEQVASGNLDIGVPADHRDELGMLGGSFNIMTQRLKTAYEDIEKGYFETTRVLAAAIEAKDPYTKGHCTRVTRYAVSLGQSIGLSRSDLRSLELSGILHDIGKIGIKDDILLKRGRLTFEEMSLMRLHPEIGKRILETVEPLRDVAEYILHHHEHFDGKGYPHGLKGEKIPLISRVMTVVDAYDSMSTNRPYRKALSEAEVIRRLQAAKGRQFDPMLLDAFLELYNADTISRIKTQAL